MKDYDLPNGDKLVIYDDVETSPMIRHHKFHEYIALGTHIGSTVEDIDAHFTATMQMVDRGDKQIALERLSNMRQAFQFAIDNIHPLTLAFGSLVHSYNGVPFTDITDSGIKGMVRKIAESGVSYSFIRDAVNYVKKKLKTR